MRATLLIAALVVLGCDSVADVTWAAGPEEKIEKVSDEGSIVAQDEKAIRLIGILLPGENPAVEGAVKCFPAAQEEIRSRLQGKNVLVKTDPSFPAAPGDGVLYAYVYEGGTMINTDLLLLGLAMRDLDHPSVVHEQEFSEAESAAKADHCGVWNSSHDFCRRCESEGWGPYDLPPACNNGCPTSMDPQLGEAMQEVLPGQPLCASSFADADPPIVQLHFKKRGIESLEGLECFSNVGIQDLRLQGNLIVDVSPLAAFGQPDPGSGKPALNQLYLTDNEVVDVSPLAGLSSLTYLGLSDNTISDPAPLAQLTNLVELHLTGNNIEDLSGLESLTLMEKLALGGNSISEIEGLTELTQLRVLGLTGNTLKEFPAFADFSSLTDLELGGNKITSLSGLVSSPGLGKAYGVGTGPNGADEPVVVNLAGNPIECTAEKTNIEILVCCRNVVLDLDKCPQPTEEDCEKLKANLPPEALPCD